MNWCMLGVIGASVFVATAGGANVLVLSSSDPGTDAAIEQRLEGFGHSVTVGPTAQAFDGSTDLSGYDTVILQLSANWADPDMPEAGQSQLRDWINGGGGLVTGEWLSFDVYWQAKFVTLEPVFPFAATGIYDSATDDTYTRVADEPLINAGLPDSFGFPLVNYDGGTEGDLVAKNGATVFYDSANLSDGLLGWGVGAGRTLSFSGTLGPEQVNDAEFGLLLSNAVEWAGGGVRCYADFTGDGTLDLFDFLAFVNSFNAGDDEANCDGEGGLDLFDFLCFTNEFNAGC